GQIASTTCCSGEPLLILKVLRHTRAQCQHAVIARAAELQPQAKGVEGRHRGNASARRRPIHRLSLETPTRCTASGPRLGSFRIGFQYGHTPRDLRNVTQKVEEVSVKSVKRDAECDLSTVSFVTCSGT